MTDVRTYDEIKADQLRDLGLVDIIQTPLDGVDQHPYLPWDRISYIGLQAMYIRSTEESVPTPFYHLMVHFKRERPKPYGFAIKEQEDGGFAISTVSGISAGLVPLNKEASSVIANLLMESLQFGVSEKTK